MNILEEGWRYISGLFSYKKSKDNRIFDNAFYETLDVYERENYLFKNGRALPSEEAILKLEELRDLRSIVWESNIPEYHNIYGPKITEFNKGYYKIREFNKGYYFDHLGNIIPNDTSRNVYIKLKEQDEKQEEYSFPAIPTIHDMNDFMWGTKNAGSSYFTTDSTTKKALDNRIKIEQGLLKKQEMKTGIIFIIEDNRVIISEEMNYMNPRSNNYINIVNFLKKLDPEYTVEDLEEQTGYKVNIDTKIENYFPLNLLEPRGFFQSYLFVKNNSKDQILVYLREGINGKNYVIIKPGGVMTFNHGSPILDERYVSQYKEKDHPDIINNNFHEEIKE